TLYLWALCWLVGCLSQSLLRWNGPRQFAGARRGRGRSSFFQRLVILGNSPLSTPQPPVREIFHKVAPTHQDPQFSMSSDLSSGPPPAVRGTWPRYCPFSNTGRGIDD